MGRARLAIRFAVLVLLPAAAVAAPTPADLEKTADRMIEAHRAGDMAPLAAIARGVTPDPWLIADLLLDRGESDVAAALAKAATTPDVGKLPAYVDSQRGRPDRRPARAQYFAALAKHKKKLFAEALGLLEPIDVSPRDVLSALVWWSRGAALRELKRFPEGYAAMLRAADATEAIGWVGMTAVMLGEAGRVAKAQGNYAGMVDCLTRRLPIDQLRGDRRAEAATLAGTGVALARIGQTGRALECLEKSLAIQEELKDAKNVAGALTDLGNLYRRTGDLRRARELCERALAIDRELGIPVAIARDLGNLGLAYRVLGEYAKALSLFEEQLHICEAEKDLEGMARVLGNLGNVRRALGDDEAALALHLRSLKVREELGNDYLVAIALQSIGVCLTGLARYDEALENYRRALSIHESLGNVEEVRTIVDCIGCVHEARREYPQALEFFTRALELSREAGDETQLTGTLANLAVVHRALGDRELAAQCAQESIDLAEQTGDRRRLVRGLAVLAEIAFYRPDPAAALAASRRAVAELPSLLSGLADEEGSAAREQWSGLYQVGLLAALALKDLEAVCFFLESGRAGAFLEALGGRDAIQAAVIPEEYRIEERQALAAEEEALAAYQKARAGKKLTDVRRAKEALSSARQKVTEAIGRTQRSAKAGAALVYPQPDTLAAIRGRVRPGEALVLYGITALNAVALVVTPEEARIVVLPEREKILEAAGAFDPEKAEEAMAVLKPLLFDSLGLPASVRRVIVSPDGALGLLPFSLLAGEREVVFAPSGTVLGLLSADAGRRGEGILALGDPEYGGTRLPSLPATRAEAKAIGDVVLLGADATAARFLSEVAARPRWRAVHLACHGLADEQRPSLSALALSGGNLTCVDLFRARIQADFVGLSACETARGRVYEAEGIVGLARAFLFAGAPRVLCSLWKVDDSATAALMTKFYEAWRGGLSPAAALLSAQEFVRSKEDWKSPIYWAAWVLWGLGD